MFWRNFRKYLPDAALLLSLVVLVYGRVLGYGFQTHWDDNAYILNNVASHGFSWENIKAVFDPRAGSVVQYNPLSMLSFMLDFTIWNGMKPGGYHLTSIIIHALNGLLVYRLLLRLHGERLLALLATAIFLFHPVQVESVAWIAERKGLLALFFALVSWEWYCRYLAEESRGGRFAYMVSLAAFMLSLMAKSAGVILPLILILYDRCFEKGERRLRLLDKVPFFIGAGIFAAIEIYLGIKGGSTVGYHGGGPLGTLYTMLTVFCRYLRLLLWPSGLNIEHQPPIYSTPELPVIGAALLLAALAAASYYLFKANRKLGFWVLFFWVGLLPVSNIIPQFLLMYEHYLYMPIIGVAALTGYGASRLRDRLGEGGRLFLYVSLALWLLALSVTSFQRTAFWKDSLTLFTDATAKAPGGFRAWEVLGEVHYTAGNMQASKNALEKVLKIKPDATNSINALAQIHKELGDFEKADEYLRRLFAINPKYVMGWATKGDIHLARREYGKAKEMYNKALALQPDAVQVFMLLGKLAILEKDYDAARGYFNKIEADKRQWNISENAYQLTRTEALAGRTSEALLWLERALYRGYTDYYTLNTNMELASLWSSPRFIFLMLQYFPEMESKR